jgi:cytochrome P450
MPRTTTNASLPIPMRSLFGGRSREIVAFGAGVHACIGAPLARLEIAVSMEEILARWPNFSIGEGAEKYHNPFVSGFRKLPFRTRADNQTVKLAIA